MNLAVHLKKLFNMNFKLLLILYITHDIDENTLMFVSNLNNMHRPSDRRIIVPHSTCSHCQDCHVITPLLIQTVLFLAGIRGYKV